MAARAAASSLARPNCLAVPPMRSITSTMSRSVEAVLLPSWLTASPNWFMSAMLMPNSVFSLPRAVPASPAVMLKAVDILATTSVNAGMSFLAMPSWPAAAAMAASSRDASGIFMLMAWISSPSC